LGKKASIDFKKCDNKPYCGAARACKIKALYYDRELESVQVDSFKCTGCGNCVVACPHAAVTVQ